MRRLELDAIQKILDEPVFVDGVPVVALGDDDARVLIAELRELRQFERFIREHAVSQHTRVLTLVENFDRGLRLPDEARP